MGRLSRFAPPMDEKQGQMSRSAGEATSVGENQCFGAAVHTKLVVEPGQVITDGLVGNGQLLGDACVGVAVTEQSEDLPFAPRERPGISGVITCLARQAGEFQNSRPEIPPGGLVFQQYVVARVKGHEGCLGDFPGQPFAFPEGYDLILVGVQDQRGRPHPVKEVADVYVGARGQQPMGNLRRRGAPAKFIEPADQFFRALRDETRREYLAEYGVGLVPPAPGKFLHCLVGANVIESSRPFAPTA